MNLKAGNQLILGQGLLTTFANLLSINAEVSLLGRSRETNSPYRFYSFLFYPLLIIQKYEIMEVMGFPTRKLAFFNGKVKGNTAEGVYF